MNVTIFGTGYVGLVHAAVLAEVGHDIICVDIDENKISNLIKGIIPIYEPGLDIIVKQNYDAKKLKFTTNAQEAILNSNIIFIAVGTPPDEDGSADLQSVLNVAKKIATFMISPKIIVNKSTAPVGTVDKITDLITHILNERKINLKFDVVSNPEFLKEGAAISDSMRPERIIIGTNNDTTISIMRELYEPFNRNHDRIMLMDPKSAELTKYAANAMLATKISFINEIANIAEKVGADIEKVRQGIGSDQRIGYHFIYAGCGYGGSCFPKDVRALIHTAKKVGVNPMLIQAVESVNDLQKKKIFSLVIQHFNNDIKGKIFTIWGLSFKPNTDDMRDASSRILLEALWEAGAQVQAFDPKAMEEAQRIYGLRSDFLLSGTKEAALINSDALIICTEWKSFFAPDFDLIKKSLKQPVIFDGRNLYDPHRLKEKGYIYYAIGRGDHLRS